MMRVVSERLLALAASGRRGGVIINEHTPSRDDLRAHVEVLGRHFDFIHHDDLLARLARPRARPFCLLTFDDGKLSNATDAGPELTRLGVPGVFFVVTRYLRDGTPLWFDRYKVLRTRLGRAPEGLEPEVVKSLPHALIEERLDRACARHGIGLEPHPDFQPMTWEQARALARAGFTIGAHTLRHPILTCETESEALRQIAESIADVQAELGMPCATFAFPNGNYTAQLARHALGCGVATVHTTEPLWVDGGFPAWRLPRVQLHPGQSETKVALKLAVAATGCVLEDPNGTGRVYRRIERLARRRSHG
jgi:peptidoglycan/xylan/chitin deacetylase (PgdA/CDA1 family)